MKHNSMGATAEIEEEISMDILSGQISPGGMLPSIRTLARRFGTTIPTIQRVIARLRNTGLLDVQHGKRIRIRDPQSSASFSVLPRWIRSLGNQPDRASKLLEDFLELRRVVASHLLANHPDKIIPALEKVLKEQSSRLTDQGVAGVADADLKISRAVLESTGQTAAIMLFNTLEDLVRNLPSVSNAIYASPMENLMAMNKVRELVSSGESPHQVRAEVEEIFAVIDRQTVSRFRAALRGAE
jgi:DNA-binding FadR family transcriptional regulator